MYVLVYITLLKIHFIGQTETNIQTSNWNNMHAHVPCTLENEYSQILYLVSGYQHVSS